MSDSGWAEKQSVYVCGASCNKLSCQLLIDYSGDVIFGNSGECWGVLGGHLDQGNVPPSSVFGCSSPCWSPLVQSSVSTVPTAPLYLNQTLMRLVLRYNEGCVGSSKTVLNLNKIDWKPVRLTPWDRPTPLPPSPLNTIVQRQPFYWTTLNPEWRKTEETIKYKCEKMFVTTKSRQ